MASAHQIRMVFVIERCTSKINQSYFRILKKLLVLLVALKLGKYAENKIPDCI